MSEPTARRAVGSAVCEPRRVVRGDLLEDHRPILDGPLLCDPPVFEAVEHQRVRLHASPDCRDPPQRPPGVPSTTNHTATWSPSATAPCSAERTSGANN